MRSRRSSPCYGRSARLVLAIATSLAVLMLTPADAAAEPGIEILEAGWDGAAAYGTWTPIRLRIAGGDRDARALVQIVVEAPYQGGAGKLSYIPLGAYGRMVSLAAGSSRELTIWFPTDSETRTRARLVVDGRALAETEVSLQMARPGWPLIAVLAEAPAIARAVGRVELPYQGLPLPLAVAGISADSIPDSGERLRALNALIVQGAAGAELTDSRRSAILEWVEAGGHLVLMGGPGATSATAVLPDGALPLSFSTDASPADVSALAGWLRGADDLPGTAPVARFQADAGTAIAGTAESPLAWRTSIGQGTVTLLAVDPALEPFASWPGTPSLLEQALAPALTQAGETGKAFPGQFPGGAIQLQGAIMTLPPDAQPGWPLAAGALGGFALIAGPVLYVVLRRVNRREWIWLVVPAGGLVFAVALYVVSIGSGGRDLVANAVSYIHLGEPSEPARQGVAVGFYAPTHERLVVTLPPDGSARAISGRGNALQWAIRRDGENEARAAEPPFIMIEGSERRVEFSGGQYEQRAVLFDRLLSDAPRVRAEIGVEDGLLVGTIRNDTGLPLEHAAVIAGSSAARLGSLAPGQSVPVRLEAAVAGGDPFGGQQPLSYAVFGEPLSPDDRRAFGVPPGMPEPMNIPSDPEIQRRAQLLDQLLMVSGRFGPGEQQVPLTFVAYTRAPTIGNGVLPEGHPAYELTLLRQDLRITLSPGPFVMPPGLLPAAVIETATPFGFGGGSNGQISWVELRAGSLTYSFRPPLPGGARIESLVLTTQQVGSAVPAAPGASPPPAPRPGAAPGAGAGLDPAEAGVFSVFDWERSEWEALGAGMEHRLSGDRYAGPGGEVRVRVAAGEAEIVRFLTPSLALEGQMPEAGSR